MRDIAIFEELDAWCDGKDHEDCDRDVHEPLKGGKEKIWDDM